MSNSRATEATATTATTATSEAAPLVKNDALAASSSASSSASTDGLVALDGATPAAAAESAPAKKDLGYFAKTGVYFQELLGDLYAGNKQASLKETGLSFLGLPSSWKAFIGWQGYSKTSSKVLNGVAVPFVTAYNLIATPLTAILNVAKLVTEVLPSALRDGFKALSTMGKDKLFGVPSFLADLGAAGSQLVFLLGQAITSPVRSFNDAKSKSWLGAGVSAMVSAAALLVAIPAALSVAIARLLPVAIVSPIAALTNQAMSKLPAVLSRGIQAFGELVGLAKAPVALLPAAATAEAALFGTQALVNKAAPKLASMVATRDAAVAVATPAPVVADAAKTINVEAVVEKQAQAIEKAKIAADMKSSVATNPATLAGKAANDVKARDEKAIADAIVANQEASQAPAVKVS